MIALNRSQSSADMVDSIEMGRVEFNNRELLAFNSNESQEETSS